MGSAPAQAQAPLTFGIQPFASPPALFKRYAPLRDWLGTEFGQPVRLESARDLPTLLARSREGRYDLILVAPHVVPLLTGNGPYRLLARSEEELAMVLLVRPGGVIDTLAGLAGRSLAVPYKESHAATLARSLTDSRDWPDLPGPPRYLHYHHNNAAVVAFQRGIADALVMIIEGNVLPARPDAGEHHERHLSLGDGSLVRILAQSERFPGLTLLVHKRLDGHTPRLHHHLTTLQESPSGTALLRHIRHRGFIEAHAAEYEPFQGALEDLETKFDLQPPIPAEKSTP
ncbi:PhnD/SsuA/transferrin family substrate-binding protein [Thioalkalivibrio sp. ALMg11]|uniref:PhnD/SsuA/transferrin family substrate-binding protein n=1 Tax=Thioalkalivibrio sp. ALMg11 TaxID=1158165 RepID=UPI0004774EA4